MSDEPTESDESYAEFMRSPILTPPTFDEVSGSIDAILDIDMHGRKMFPLYMRPPLKLSTLRYMKGVVAAIPSSPRPFTQHDLHTRLFTFLVKNAAKLAHTDDERITIICPDAPHVGSKVPHPQWPELTTVVRRFFTAESQLSSMQVDEERLRTDGTVKVSELFSGLDMERVQLIEADALVDVDDIDEALIGFDGEDAVKDPRTLSPDQRSMWEAQKEAREQAKALMRERIRALKAKRAAAKAGKPPPPVPTKGPGLIRALAVVYRFDSGDEFEMRYPLTKKDVKKLELIEMDDDDNTIIIE